MQISASLSRALGTLRPPIRKVGPNDTPPRLRPARLPRPKAIAKVSDRLTGLVFALRMIRKLESGLTIRVTEIAAELKIQRRTAFRYLVAIEEAGYPLYESDRGEYRLLRAKDL